MVSISKRQLGSSLEQGKNVKVKQSIVRFTGHRTLNVAVAESEASPSKSEYANVTHQN